MNEKCNSQVAHGKKVYRLGGLSALILGKGYLLTIPVLTYAGSSLFAGSEERLVILPKKRGFGGPRKMMRAAAAKSRFIMTNQSNKE